jgi:hypothetical protein
LGHLPGQSHERLFHACEFTACGQSRENAITGTRESSVSEAIIGILKAKDDIFGSKMAEIEGLVLPVD